MQGQGLPLDIDLDLIGGLVDESLPWFEAWLMLLAIMLGFAVLAAASQAVRAYRSPVRRLMRRPVRRSFSEGG